MVNPLQNWLQLERRKAEVSEGKWQQRPMKSSKHHNRNEC